MNNNIKEVILTLKKEKSHLLRRGVYQSAKVKIKNRFQKNEEVTIITPMKMLQAPVYEDAIGVVHLGEEFITNCNKNLPSSFNRSKHNVRYWETLPLYQKIHKHCVDLALDLHSEVYKIELMEE